jgi:ketosteroid isomerase-like protein
MTTTHQPSPQETQILTLRDKLTQALRQKDATAFAALYAPQTVMFVLSPPLQFKTGANAPGQTGIEAWFAGFEGPLHYQVQDLEITAGEQVAYCHSLNQLKAKRNNGEPVEMWFRETLCFRTIEGQWKVTHQHQSVPFYMDTLQAALDLKP